ncbi:arNOG08307 family NADH-binding domain protein [Natronomonas moolapensis 8.8.11]|uniref:ArNOG08307 family NADH-binding domain protein n=1 Tax=Natronomonas moolapensis (strain DSM 18674 / CECT 7526 / JCM 14361 / 8.8.11) TaxID=268739 RepID=M1Y1M0_NATM8|nr:NAD(P)H-binding protein [Natronomonas moolapensis]CCQ36371.1 arNOG08307 family NADH-binding domain protein [Natronomonas moolapensis 8.8.11]
MRTLVVGATGFVGSRLVRALDEEGHDVVAFSRSADSESFPDGVEPFAGDLGDPESLEGLCDGVDVAYYLIHSLTSENFAELDRRYAARFREIAADAGVDRVVYLSGISGDETDLSPHLASRREVETVLAEGAFDLTVLRAAVIIGPESASFRIVDDLTDRLPVLVVPQWVRTPCQPIGVQDAIDYLTGLLRAAETRGETYDIGGPSVCSYESLLRMTAARKGRNIRILPVPVMTPKLSSHWLRFTTDVQYAIARPLAESMRHPVTVREDYDIQDVVPIDRTPIEAAIAASLAESSRQASR